MRNALQLRSRQSPESHRLRGLVRRVTVGLTGKLWSLLGYEDEPFDNVEVFGGVGIAARPRAGKGEVIVIHVGAESGHPVVIAARDADIEPELQADESALFNSVAIVTLTKDGDVIVRAKAGRQVLVDDGSGAVALATKADLDALANFVQAIELPVAAGIAGPPPPGTVPTAAGTTVLRGK